MSGEFNNNLVLLAIAVFTFANTAFLWWSNHNTQKVVTETRNIALKTELNTNSMKDALVRATVLASEAKGRDEQRAIGESKAQAVAEAVALKSEKREAPIPVADDRVAEIAERHVKAAERLADAVETEEKKI